MAPSKYRVRKISYEQQRFFLFFLSTVQFDRSDSPFCLCPFCYSFGATATNYHGHRLASQAKGWTSNKRATAVAELLAPSYFSNTVGCSYMCVSDGVSASGRWQHTHSPHEFFRVVCEEVLAVLHTAAIEVQMGRRVLHILPQWLI